MLQLLRALPTLAEQGREILDRRAAGGDDPDRRQRHRVHQRGEGRAERRDRAARAGGAEHLADLPALLQRDQERRLPAGELHADVLELGGEIAGLPPQTRDLLPRGGGIAVEQPQARPGRLRPAADALERALPVGADRHQLRPHFAAADHRQPHRGPPFSHNPIPISAAH